MLGTTAMPDSAVLANVKSLIGEAGYSQIYAPIEQASGLPNTCYWSEQWFALEQQRVFQRHWVFVGAGAEIPKAGDIKPVEVGSAPLMLVRGADGVARAFHNVCRHRGAQLVTKPCRKASISCPYHAWNYGLNGQLKGRAHFQGPGSAERFPDGGGEKLDLVPARLAEWQGCLFVDLSGEAPDLMQWLSPILARTEGHDFSSIRWAGKLSYEVNANWKLVYENYMEGYHVFSLHPKLLKFAPMDVRWSGEWNRHVFFNDYQFPELQVGRGSDLPHYPNLSAEDAKRGLWFLSFPQFAAEVFPDQFTVLSATPLAPDKTREELHVFLIGDAADDETHRESREAVLDMWDKLNDEDLSVLELLQQGRRSPAYDGGRLSPHWEGPTHEFGRHLIEKILA